MPRNYSFVLILLFAMVILGFCTFAPEFLFLKLGIESAFLVRQQYKWLFAGSFFGISFYLPFLCSRTKIWTNQLSKIVNLRYLAAIYLIVTTLSFIGVVTWFLNLDIAIITAALIGSAIPAFYYVYLELIKRPTLEVSDLRLAEIRVVPMYYIRHIARPAILIPLKIENKGNATAKDCAIKVTLVQKNKETRKQTYYARWANPGNDEKYNLLPGESQKVHLLKVFLTSDFFIVKPWSQSTKNKLEDEVKQKLRYNKLSELIDKTIYIAGNPAGKVRIKEENGKLIAEEITKGDIMDQFSVYTPKRKPPEREEKSVRGGWMGNEIRSVGVLKIKIQPIAENYKKSEKSIKVGEQDFINLRLGNFAQNFDDIKWQKQWEEKGYSEFQDTVIPIMKGIKEEG